MAGRFIAATRFGFSVGSVRGFRYRPSGGSSSRNCCPMFGHCDFFYGPIKNKILTTHFHPTPWAETVGSKAWWSSGNEISLCSSIGRYTWKIQKELM